MLTETGWVLLHDRIVDGTSGVVDTLLVGPPGLVIVRAQAGTVHRAPDGQWWCGNEPVEPAREHTAWLAGEVVERTSRRMPGWSLLAWCAVVAARVAEPRPDLAQSPQVLTSDQMCAWVSQLRATLSELQVADLAAAVHDVCPPAPLY